jgi:hypothetical protein
MNSDLKGGRMIVFGRRLSLLMVDRGRSQLCNHPAARAMRSCIKKSAGFA